MHFVTKTNNILFDLSLFKNVSGGVSALLRTEREDANYFDVGFKVSFYWFGFWLFRRC